LRYFGGKERISKSLSLFLNEQLQENQCFVDLFCGSCNVISKIDNNRMRIANDKHKYLIAMWQSLQKGYELPQNLSKEQYLHIKDHLDDDPALSGFVGFGCSFGGKWFGGYANTPGRNYCSNAYNSTMKKFSKLQDVQFYNNDYSNFILPDNSLIYCDIPYKNTTQYCTKEVGIFDHDKFYDWVGRNSSRYDIFISEYSGNVPLGYEIVWSVGSKQDMHNKTGKKAKTEEVLIKVKSDVFEMAV